MKRFLILYLFYSCCLTYSLPSEATTIGSICDKIIKEQLYAFANKSLGKKNSVVYKAAKGLPGKVLHLSRQEYIEAVAQKQIDPDHILLLDDIDLEEDLPMIAGLVLGRPLYAEGSHVEMQCKKLGIPLAYAYDLEELNQQATSELVALDTRNGTTKIVPASRDDLKQVAASVLPPAPTTSIPQLITPASSTGDLISEGGKFLPLAELANNYPEVPLPEISAANNGYYDQFISETKISSNPALSLKSFINQSIEELKDEEDSDKIKSQLELIQSEILNAPTPVDTSLHKLYQELVEKYGFHTTLSIRSNNNVEDFISAGLYKSTIAPLTKFSSFAQKVKEVWASLYEYRAYNIRSYRNLIEEHLSMPLLIHPFIGNEKANGVAKVTLDEYGNLLLEANIVMGSDSRATNPNAESNTHKVYAKWDNGLNLLKVHSDSNVLDESIRVTMRKLYYKIREPAYKILSTKKFPPDFIELEFLLMPGKDTESYWSPLILQFKNSYNNSIMADLLTGKMSLYQLQEELNLDISNDEGIERVRKNHDLDALNWLVSKTPRYLLVSKEDSYYILSWDDGRTHENIIQSKILQLMEFKVEAAGLIHSPSNNTLKFAIRHYANAQYITAIDYAEMHRKAIELDIESTRPSIKEGLGHINQIFILNRSFRDISANGLKTNKEASIEVNFSNQ